MTVRIYVATVEEGREWLIASGQVHRWPLGDGQTQAATWQPDEVRVLTESDGKPLKHADIPWMTTGVLVLSPKAYEATRALLAPWGEFLPVRTVEGRDYQIFNPLVRSDALDEDRSDIVRLDTGLMLSIRRHVFHPDRLGTAGVFGLRQLRNSNVFLTGDIVDQIVALGLHGTTFKLVWESQASSEE